MRVEVSGGVGIEVEVSGEGQPVVLLHGFPDSGRLWHEQVPALTEAGFRVIVPDLRGYSASDNPDGIESYGIPALVGDVFGVLDHLGVERAHFVGHDWRAPRLPRTPSASSSGNTASRHSRVVFSAAPAGSRAYRSDGQRHKMRLRHLPCPANARSIPTRGTRRSDSLLLTHC